MRPVGELVRTVATSGLRSRHRWPAEPLDDGTWTELLRHVRAERLTGLLVHAIREASLPAAEEQTAQAEREHLVGFSRVMVLEAGAVEVIRQLASGGVRARVLKGPAVAHLDYPDPALRLYVDLDLIVPSAHFDTAVSTLAAAGYVRCHPEPRAGFDRRFSKGTSFVSPQMEIDLHRTFVMGPFGLRVQLEDVWGPGSTLALGDVQVEVLDPELRFLHACFHTALGDVVPRLVPQRDVAQMLSDGHLDLERIDRLMRRWQAEAVVARAVTHTWHTLELVQSTALTEWALSYKPSARALRELSLYSDPDKSYARMCLGALSAVPGLRDKTAFLYALAFPKRSYLDGRHRSMTHRWWSALRAVTRSAWRA